MDFIERYEREIFRTIKKFKLVENSDNIFIALSGGKDSFAAGYMLTKYVKDKDIDCSLSAFHINFGSPFSNKVQDVVRKQANLLNLPLVVSKVSEYGIDMEKVAKLSRPICSSCGIIKRYLMNKVPREMGATKIATGHHADDFLTFFFKNMLGENFEWISKFTPLLPTSDNSLARIRPLFFVGRKDNEKLCNIMNFPYINDDICPHGYLKCAPESKGKWYEIIDYIQSKQPDFRKNMMLSISKLANRIPIQSSPNKCKKCGEPTNSEICAFCRIVDAIK